MVLERWREIDALFVLERLGCYAKVDRTFEPMTAHGTQRYRGNAEGQDFELPLRGPKCFDTRLKHGGGEVDLVMHVRRVDFKGATDLLHRLAVWVPHVCDC